MAFEQRIRKSEMNVTLPMFILNDPNTDLAENLEKKDRQTTPTGGRMARPGHFLSNRVHDWLFSMLQDFQANQRNVRKSCIMCQLLSDSYTILTTGWRVRLEDQNLTRHSNPWILREWRRGGETTRHRFLMTELPNYLNSLRYSDGVFFIITLK